MADIPLCRDFISLSRRNLSTVVSDDSGDSYDMGPIEAGVNFTLDAFMESNQSSTVLNCLYGVLLGCGLVGNLVFLRSLITSRDCDGRSRLRPFLFNLVVADILVCCFTISMEFGWRQTVVWTAGDFCCRLFSFTKTVGLYLATFVVVAMSIDRCYAIWFPMKLNGAPRRARISLALAWIAAVLCSLPQVCFFIPKTHTHCIQKHNTHNTHITHTHFNTNTNNAHKFQNFTLQRLISNHKMEKWKKKGKQNEKSILEYKSHEDLNWWSFNTTSILFWKYEVFRYYSTTSVWVVFGGNFLGEKLKEKCCSEVTCWIVSSYGRSIDNYFHAVFVNLWRQRAKNNQRWLSIILCTSCYV